MRKSAVITSVALFVLTTVVDDANAATLTVCPIGCTSTTIQGAINAASPGDTITVAAGTYNENVDVNKTLTLLGAQANVDARTRSGPESIINGAVVGPDPVSFNADNIVLNGFTVQGANNTGTTNAGIWTNPALSSTQGGFQILNNIVQNNIIGLYLNGTVNPNVVQFNLFRNNNNPGPASGNGIYSDLGLANASIDNNTFSNNLSSAMVFVGTQSGLTISHNVADNVIGLQSTTASSITDNTVTSTPSSNGSEISLFGGDNGIAISGNTLQNGLRGIRVRDAGAGINANVTVHQNNLVGNTTAGLEVESAGHTGTLDATCNWWGSASGPSNPANPTGTGNAVIGDASFRPWLTAPAPGPCNGGLPKPPRKPREPREPRERTIVVFPGKARHHTCADDLLGPEVAAVAPELWHAALPADACS